MTTSIGLSDIPETLLRRYPIEVLIKNVNAFLRAYSPEYLTVLENANLSMLGYIYKQIYTDRGFVSPAKWFHETKMLECFSFWSGYLKTSGRLPSPLRHPYRTIPSRPPPIRKSRSRISALIPVGSNWRQYHETAIRTFEVLQRSPVITDVIYVLNGATDFTDHFGRLTNCLDLGSETGPAIARNKGVGILPSDRSAILFADIDVLLSDSALNQLIYFYSQHNCWMAVPRLVSYTETKYDRYHDLAGTLNGRYASNVEKHRLIYGTTACMIVNRRLFDSGLAFCEQYPEAAGEDIDFCLSANQQGFSVSPVDDVYVHHVYGYTGEEAVDLAKFKARFERYGACQPLLEDRHPYLYTLLEDSIPRSSCLLQKAK
jgi:hypothetical protein